MSVDLAELATMTGLETMQAIAAGELPPPSIALAETPHVSCVPPAIQRGDCVDA